MDAILLLSHGSVLCGAERNLLELAERLRERGDAPIVEVGFLNYSKPALDEAVERCVEAGATRLSIALWFLVAGTFVKEELPGRIERLRQIHPQLELFVAKPIGFHARLADVVLACAERAKPAEAWRRELQEAAQWCRNSPRCPIHRVPPCPAAGAGESS